MEHKDSLVNDYEGGIKVSALAARHGVSEWAIYTLFKELKVDTYKGKIHPSQREAIFHEYQTTNITMRELSNRFGVNHTSMRELFENAGIPIRHNDALHTWKINNQFFDTLTEESLWVLGWFYTDGNVSKKEYCVNIGVQHGDEEVLYKIQNAMGAKKNFVKRPKTRNLSLLRLDSKKIHGDLIKLGCVPAKSLILTYPTFLTEDWQHWAFLRGVLEGDGCITKRKKTVHVYFSSGSLAFQESIKNVLETRLGVKSKIRFMNSGYGCGYSLDITIRQDSMTVLDKIYANAPERLRMARKYEYYAEAKAMCATLPTQGNISRFRMVETHYMHDSGQIYKIKGIDPFAKEMGIKRDHAYSLAKYPAGKKYAETPWTKPSPEAIAAAEATGSIIEKIY